MCVQQARCRYLSIGISNLHNIKFVIHFILGSRRQAFLVWYSPPVFPVKDTGVLSCKLHTVKTQSLLGCYTMSQEHAASSTLCLGLPEWFSLLCCFIYLTFLYACHFSAITPNWNLTQIALFSQFSTTKLIQRDIPKHSNLAQVVLLLTHIQEMPSSYLSMGPNLTEVFHGFLADTNTAPPTMPNHLFPYLFKFTVYWLPYQNWSY
jgi:hypothetical protein